jgi:hypothetical protein
MANRILTVSKYVAALHLVLLKEGAQVASAEELKKLKALQVNWATLQKHVDETGHGTVKARILQAREKYQKDPSPKNFEELHRIESTDFTSAHNQARAAVAQLIEQQLPPILCPILNRCADTVQKCFETVEKDERAQAECYGVPFEPSTTCQAIRGLHEQLLERIKYLSRSGQLCGSSPAGIVKDLGLEL